MTTKNICIFGDSIAYGAWSRDGGWAERLRVALQRRTLDSGFQEYYFLYNESIPGDTTDDVLKRFASECEARKPHIVLFAIGINDASCRGDRHMPRVSPESFKKNIRTLLGAARGRAETIAAVGLTRVDEKLTMPFENTYFSNSRIAEYDAALQKICRESSIRHLDVSHLLSADDLEDGLHPNDVGHEKIFRTVETVLLPSE